MSFFANTADQEVFATVAKQLAFHAEQVKMSASKMAEHLKPLILAAMKIRGCEPWTIEQLQKEGGVPKKRGEKIRTAIVEVMVAYVNADEVAQSQIREVYAFKGGLFTNEHWKVYMDADHCKGKPKGRTKTVYDAVGRAFRDAGYQSKLMAEKGGKTVADLVKFFESGDIDIDAIAEAATIYSRDNGIQVGYTDLLRRFDGDTLLESAAVLQEERDKVFRAAKEEAAKLAAGV